MEWIKPEIKVINIVITASGAAGTYDGPSGSDMQS